MRVLVYGAGVIGCYLTHVLCRVGNDVTLLARLAFKAGREYPTECRETRIDIDEKLSRSILEW